VFMASVLLSVVVDANDSQSIVLILNCRCFDDNSQGFFICGDYLILLYMLKLKKFRTKIRTIYS